MDVSLIFNDADLFHHLGFNQDSINRFDGGELTSTNVIDLQIENILYIHSDLCSNGSDDVLQEVCTAGVPDFAYVNWTNHNLEAYSKQLVSKTKKTFYIYLTDKDGVEIFLNGVDMNLTLILYRRNDIYELTRGYINYLLVKEHETIQISSEI
ncbi:hypothetical protein SAMD00019534_111450 [Acytostelium subglobosum LB1]|uniref:hypothetical protein n=1 Tax=Acytostelium subglobosum LB1 TaxID=1410327 RepID=UPI0006449483|nr:hypothetical protein SAMD00019534_111450 [Acytostelium subglobosum LB1]GAM27969.1 hypothetical protein SAMD00019534_111450 [Acytostelium subglobosum LB1]|eukprot:XP_012748928.1 hypothetical protein SAMD00019534_111450 [Acytostelium subglobosum LB1]